MSLSLRADLLLPPNMSPIFLKGNWRLFLKIAVYSSIGSITPIILHHPISQKWPIFLLLWTTRDLWSHLSPVVTSGCSPVKCKEGKKGRIRSRARTHSSLRSCSVWMWFCDSLSCQSLLPCQSVWSVNTPQESACLSSFLWSQAAPQFPHYVI